MARPLPATQNKRRSDNRDVPFGHGESRLRAWAYVIAGRLTWRPPGLAMWRRPVGGIDRIRGNVEALPKRQRGSGGKRRMQVNEKEAQCL